MILGIVLLMPLAVNPLAARADDAPPVDGRFQEYKETVAPPPAATSLQWLSLIGLGVVGLGVLFLNAKRTHLD